MKLNISSENLLMAVARGRRPSRRTLYVNDAVEIEVYSIGYLSIYTGASKVTIRNWERRKVVPKPLISVGGVRYYTSGEILAMAPILKTHLMEAKSFKAGRDTLMSRLKKAIDEAVTPVRKVYRNLTDQNKAAYNKSYFKLPKADALHTAMQSASKKAMRIKAGIEPKS